MSQEYDHDFFNTKKKKRAKKPCVVENTHFPEHSNIARKIDAIGRKHHGCSVVEAIDNLLQEMD